MKKLMIGADGKIYALLLDLIANHGDQYRWVLPYLGKKLVNGLFSENTF